MSSVSTDRIDGLSSDVAIKAPCRVATTANITMSGLQTIDGVALANLDRVLVWLQTDATQNGIFVCRDGEAWTRALDFNGARDTVYGTTVYVTSGATHQRTFFILETTISSFGTTHIEFVPRNSGFEFGVHESVLGSDIVSRVIQFNNISYTPGIDGNLIGQRNGQMIYSGRDYTEPGTNSATYLTLTFDPLDSDVFDFYTNLETLGAYDGDASQMQYLPAGTGAVATNVQARLRRLDQSTTDWVSLLDPYWGVAANGSADDTDKIQDALDYCVSTNKTLFVPKHLSGAGYKITSALTIPITADNVSIMGAPGASIYNAGTGYALDIGDNTTANDRTFRITLRDLMFEGTGWTDNTKPNQGGIRARGYLCFTLDNVFIGNLPGVGLELQKSQAAGSAYANNTVLVATKIRFTGKQAILAGDVYALDDFQAFGCMFNNSGNLESAASGGGCYIVSQTVDIGGCEISAMTNYKNGMVLRRATGLVHGCHFENNGNNVSDSADLFLDSDANGLAIIGTNHGCNYTTAAKYGVRTTSKNNYIANICMDGGANHVFDAVVRLVGAENANVFNAFTKDTAYTPNNTWVQWSSKSEASLIVSNGSMKEPESYVYTAHSDIPDSDVSAANDTITIAGHDFVEGDNCYINGAGTPPTGLQFYHNYYVHVVDANTIKLKTWEAPAGYIDITAAGTGPFQFNKIAYGSLFDLWWYSGSDAFINIPIKIAGPSFSDGSPKIQINPANQAAATAMGSSKCPYVSALNIGTYTYGVHIETADATSVGTNTRWIVRLTPD